MDEEMVVDETTNKEKKRNFKTERVSDYTELQSNIKNWEKRRKNIKRANTFLDFVLWVGALVGAGGVLSTTQITDALTSAIVGIISSAFIIISPIASSLQTSWDLPEKQFDFSRGIQKIEILISLWEFKKINTLQFETHCIELKAALDSISVVSKLATNRREVIRQPLPHIYLFEEIYHPSWGEYQNPNSSSYDPSNIPPSTPINPSSSES